MTDPDVLPVLDDEPRDGVYRHLEDAPPTADEIALGNALGEVINIDDDDDRDGGML